MKKQTQAFAALSIEGLISLTASGCVPCEASADTMTLATDTDVKEREAPADIEVEELPEQARWRGVIGFENEMTGDGRFIESGALRWADLPIPFRYVSSDVGAHDGAEVVGTIDSIERGKPTETGAIPLIGEGRFDTDSEIGREAFRQVDGGYTTGVSMDLDDVTFEVRIAQEVLDQMMSEPDIAALETDENGRVIMATIKPDDEVSITTDGRVRAATIVAVPAFAGARIGVLLASAGPMTHCDGDECPAYSTVKVSTFDHRAGTVSMRYLCAEHAAAPETYGGNPTQARAPKGTSGGGRWIDTPTGILASLRESTGGGGDDVEVRVGAHSFRGSIAPQHGQESALTERGFTTPELVMAREADADSAAAFHQAISDAKASSPYGSSVDVHDVADYEGATLLMTKDGLGGLAVTKDGAIISGFSHADNPAKGFVQHGVMTAVANGGTHLDAYDTVLPKLYATAGFEPTARIKFDREYAPEDWDYDLYAPFNNGEPDVVFMKYNPEKVWGTYDPSAGEYMDDWDEAVATSLATKGDGHVNFSVGPEGLAQASNLLIGGSGGAVTPDELHAFVVGNLGPGGLGHGMSVRGVVYRGNPGQARAPEGTPIGGRWIQTPTGYLPMVAGRIVAGGAVGIPALAGDHDDLAPDAVDPAGRAYGPEAVAEANALHERALMDEPTITADMHSALGSTDYEDRLNGLEFRVKEQKSLAKKIRGDMEADGLTPSQAANGVFDAVRYTAVSDAHEYGAASQAALDALKAKGYEVGQVKNFWVKDDMAYKGINVKLVSPNGTQVELQFHTPESFEAKMSPQMHKVYDEQKLAAKGSPEWWTYERQMMDFMTNEVGVTTPPGAVDVT